MRVDLHGNVFDECIFAGGNDVDHVLVVIGHIKEPLIRS
jgi:hypothetical protein